MPFFAKNAQIVDVHGKRWNCDEIAKNFETLFVPYAKKNASYTIEDTLISSNDQLVALVLWKNALVASMERVWMHRMTVVLVPNGDDWAIVAMQVTPVQPCRKLTFQLNSRREAYAKHATLRPQATENKRAMIYEKVKRV